MRFFVVVTLLGTSACAPTPYDPNGTWDDPVATEPDDVDGPAGTLSPLDPVGNPDPAATPVPQAQATPVPPPPPPPCGDDVCDGGAGENCLTCVLDCGTCGATCASDGVCDALAGESCGSCPNDCDTSAPVCGNGACDSGESASTCAADCGPTSWPADWLSYEEEVLYWMNEHRAAGTNCPTGARSPTTPLSMDPALQVAAQLHSWDQAYADYFDHFSCNGRSPWERASAAGGSAYSENIAWGQQSPEAAVNSWMSSWSGHCSAIMDPGHDYVGVGVSELGGGPIWTAMFR